ncbi:MAG: 23S rRNA (uracil(1939)-C(5))-methyltransferase RlmD [bacterium]
MVTSSASANTKTVELNIERLVPGGAGLAILNGLKVFVPFAAPEERVRAKIILRKADYAVARIEEIVDPSPLRRKPICPYYGRCGGCQLQHISYTGQLVIKKLLVNDALQRIGRIFLPVANINFQSAEWHYRNKTQYPVRGGKQLQIGFYEKGSHHLIDIPNCLLHPEEFDRLRQYFFDTIIQHGERGYDELRHQGNIRHIILRQGQNNTFLIIVVTRTRDLNPVLVKAWADLPPVNGIVQNINPEPTNRILGGQTLALCGKEFIAQEVLGKRFRISARSFFQVNIVQAEELARRVLKAVMPTGVEVVVDLYSGVGMLSLLIADKVKKVTGIEIDPDAITDARYNAEIQGAKNVQFIQGDVDKMIARIDAADVIILDPPRKGCNPQTLSQIVHLQPRMIVYVSCNPATLARDLAILEKLDYTSQQIEPLDMFPQTAHIEVVARLTKK